MFEVCLIICMVLSLIDEIYACRCIRKRSIVIFVTCGFLVVWTISIISLVTELIY